MFVQLVTTLKEQSWFPEWWCKASRPAYTRLHLTSADGRRDTVYHNNPYAFLIHIFVPMYTSLKA